MNVLRIGFVGTRTENFQQTAEFFHRVLGLPAAFEKPDWTGFRLPSGKNDFVEVFGPAMKDAKFFPEGVSGVLVAFIVADLAAAYAEVAAAGVELLSEPIWVGEGFGWFFLRAPDDNIYTIQQVPE